MGIGDLRKNFRRLADRIKHRNEPWELFKSEQPTPKIYDEISLEDLALAKRVQIPIEEVIVQERRRSGISEEEVKAVSEELIWYQFVVAHHLVSTLQQEELGLVDARGQTISMHLDHPPLPVAYRTALASPYVNSKGNFPLLFNLIVGEELPDKGEVVEYFNLKRHQPASEKREEHKNKTLEMKWLVPEMHAFEGMVQFYIIAMKNQAVQRRKRMFWQYWGQEGEIGDCYELARKSPHIFVAEDLMTRILVYARKHTERDLSPPEP